MTLCLCCGSRYEDGFWGDCPNLEVEPHSTELALEVARRLLEQEIVQPTPEQVKEAVRSIHSA